MGSYVPNTKESKQSMLSAIGFNNIEELYSAIPDEVKLKENLNIPDGLTEIEVKARMEKIALKNNVYKSIFRVCGAYNHYIPAAVKYVTSKEEFVTAYTPYQAEISQGVLQSIFEYQSMICSLTGMDVSNASVYDGATACAEAVLMCTGKKKQKVMISGAMHPHIKETVKTYLNGTGYSYYEIPCNEGKTDIGIMLNNIDDTTACILVSQISFFGQLENLDGISKAAKDNDVRLIINCNPISLAILKSPAEYGADIAVGDGQPLGIPLSFGGPYLGFMACTTEMMRRLPGRIVGETTDHNGERAFVLTLQAREQHIRREKAQSNICSNQALCALKAAVYMSVTGREGMRKAAMLSLSKAHYLRDALCSIEGIVQVYKGEFFNEFVTSGIKDTDKLMNVLSNNGILGGYPYEGNIIWCATELNSKEDIDRLAKLVKEVVLG